MSDINRYSHKTFESIKHKTEDGLEYWYARELQYVLEYADWRNFIKVVEKAKVASENSNYEVSDHFVDVTNMVKLYKTMF